MNTVINQHLFRHRETKSTGLNNLCTVIHKLSEEGLYVGEVVQGERLLGTFRLTCDEKNEQSQVNIDLSAFDTLFRANVPDLPTPDHYAVGKSGYVVFHVSGHHNGLYVKLTEVSKEKKKPSFDSRRLDKGDMVGFRLWYAGSYTITNEVGGQKAALTVLSGEGRKLPDLTKVTPVRVSLSEKGFDPAQIEKWPVQALVINVDTGAALSLQGSKAMPDKSGDTKVKRTAKKQG